MTDHQQPRSPIPTHSYEGTPDLPLPVLRRMALHGGQEVSWGRGRTTAVIHRHRHERVWWTQNPSSYTRHAQPAPRQPPRAPQPTVVFREDQAESEWSLVDLHHKNNANRHADGGDPGATTMRGGGGVSRRMLR